jgi:hypothetical protein
VYAQFHLSTISFFNTCDNRLVTTVAHVPWLFTYLRFIPGAATIRARVFAIAEEYVNQRVNEGSDIKDLFYYLVSQVVMFFWLSCSLIPRT